MISRVIGKTILSPNLAEFARPVRQDRRSAFVREVGLPRPVRPVIAAAHEPPPVKLVLSRAVHTESALLKRRLLALSPDELAAAHERVVDGAPQRLPPNRRIDFIKVRDEIRPQFVVTASIGKPEFQVRRLRQVLVAAQVLHRAHIAFLMRLEHQLIPRAGIAAKYLPSRGKKNAFRKRDYALDRKTRVVYP